MSDTFADRSEVICRQKYQVSHSGYRVAGVGSLSSVTVLIVAVVKVVSAVLEVSVLRGVRHIMIVSRVVDTDRHCHWCQYSMYC